MALKRTIQIQLGPSPELAQKRSHHCVQSQSRKKCQDSEVCWAWRDLPEKGDLGGEVSAGLPEKAKLGVHCEQ